MPKWIHDRAEHILSKNPGMDKSQAFAIATQQSYATGKAPKDYGTSEGRHEAKKKYDEPKKSYELAADPEKTAGIDLSTTLMHGFADELCRVLEKKAGVAPPPPANAPTPDAMSQIKTTQPKPTTGIKGVTASYSKPNTVPSQSPGQGYQPVADAPPVRT